MLIIAGKITMDASKVDDAKPAIQEMMDKTHQEPGNMDYAFSVDMAEAGVLRIFEKWESPEALEEHMASEHMKEFMGKFGEFGVAGADVKKYEVSAELDAF